MRRRDSALNRRTGHQDPGGNVWYDALEMRAAKTLIVPLVLLAGSGYAGQSANLPYTVEGPPPPAPPEVISRDASGRVTIRAVRVVGPLRVDGQLDEATYAANRPMSDFIQIEPKPGSPATEKTELWLLFDDDRVYVAGRCWESQPARMVANEMRRDNNNAWQNDHLAFVFDTFYDRRNSVEFAVTPIGGRMDGQITSERQYNGDWNTVWAAAVGRFEGGWTFEVAIPFKSLRYRPGPAQIWGFNARRSNRWKNEMSYLTALPAGRGMGAIMLASLAATVVGLEAPPGSRNLEVKPYATANLTSDLTASPPVSNNPGGDVGADVKYGITQNLTADVTVNTDFAQVEADELQVNLTRFNLFFPEKREFFLENQGTFAFGGVSTFGQSAGSTDTPTLFYSRRIGLDRGRAVPILAGGRLTGRLGRFNVGVLNIQSNDEPARGALATNFSAVRVKRDVLRRSSIGALLTRRSVGQNGIGANEAYGIDGTFSFFDNLSINTYWAQTRTAGLSGDDTSYRTQLDYTGDRYGVQLERLAVGAHFNPEIGFVRRADMRKNFGQFRFSPRPRSIQSVRKFSWIGSIGYFENGMGRLETRERDAEFAVEFQSSDRLSIAFGDSREFLPRPFRIASGVTLPVGTYDFVSVRTGVTLGQQRRVSANVAVEHGTFYSGHKTVLDVGRGRMNLTPQLSIEPRLSITWVDLLEGSFATRLVGSRVTYTMSPLMFASALLQYNSCSNAVAANVRLRWEYQPGSELFVVFNEQRDTLASRFPTLANRALIVKINRLLRF
jgi:hypothetical protein